MFNKSGYQSKGADYVAEGPEGQRDSPLALKMNESNGDNKARRPQKLLLSNRLEVFVSQYLKHSRSYPASVLGRRIAILPLRHLA